MTRDERRYLEKVREAIKKKLPEVIKGGDILSAPPGSKYPVKVPYLDIPTLRRPRPAGGSGGGGGSGPGDGGGEPHIVVEVPLEEIVEILFAELRLPALPKGGELEEAKPSLEGISRTGTPQRLHLRRTALEAEKRGELYSGALRYRDIREERRPITSAVAVIARDSSGSMTEDRRYIAKVASLWLVLYLRRLYAHVALRFVVHDAQAIEVSESDFFKVETGGGTKVSSAWDLAEKILREYPKEGWNRYVFYFSDGENFPEDDDDLARVLDRFVPTLELVVYGEVDADPWRGGLIPLFRRHGVRAGRVASPQAIAGWLREVLGGE